MLKNMPDTGTDWDSLRAEMIKRGGNDAKWREGKTAVYVFNAGEDVTKVQKEAYTLYMSENGLGPLAFPSLKQMEDEVVGMVPPEVMLPAAPIPSTWPLKHHATTRGQPRVLQAPPISSYPTLLIRLSIKQP